MALQLSNSKYFSTYSKIPPPGASRATGGGKTVRTILKLNCWCSSDRSQQVLPPSEASSWCWDEIVGPDSCEFQCELRNFKFTLIYHQNSEVSKLPNSHLNGSYLVDPASSHMLVSKIKPCMSKYKHLYGETADGSLKQLWFIWWFLHYLDTRSNSRANTCVKGRLTKPCIY